jgi:hypothetical protein
MLVLKNHVRFFIVVRLQRARALTTSSVPEAGETSIITCRHGMVLATLRHGKLQLIAMAEREMYRV